MKFRNTISAGVLMSMMCCCTSVVFSENLALEATATCKDKPASNVNDGNYATEWDGVSLAYDVKEGDEVRVKIGISYTSIENARKNLETECDHWDFDRVRDNARRTWNEWLGRIEVKGVRERMKRMKREHRKLIHELDDPVKDPPASMFATEADLPTTHRPKPDPRTAKPVSTDSKTTLVSRLEAGEKQTIVTYGTSLTKVGARPDQLATVLEQNYPGQVTLINRGRGGSNSVWGRKSFDDMVIQKKPDTVFIEFSINDAVAGRKVSVEQARENLEYKPAVIFHHTDADHDGTIRLKEYQAIYVVHFTKRDANSDGALDESEIWIVK